jgi:Fibronectin type III domain
MKHLPLIVFLGFATSAFAQSPPGAPQNLTSNVSGSTVTLNWAAPSTGLPTGYIVEASVVPGGPLVASLPVAATTLTVPNVPTGTYFVRVRALNAAVQGPPSNEVTVSVAASGCPGPPAPPVLTVRSTALRVTVLWTTGPGCPSTSYRLLAGTGPGLANVANLDMGGQLGLTVDAPAGTYFVRVIGTNPFGTSAPTQDLVLRVGPNLLTDTAHPNGVVAFDVVLTSTGNYVATLTWVDPSIDLDFYLTSPGCPYPPTTCLLAISDAVGVNVETVTRPVAAGESYRLYVDNFTNRTTAFTILNSVLPADEGTDAEQDAAVEPRIRKSRR